MSRGLYADDFKNVTWVANAQSSASEAACEAAKTSPPLYAEISTRESVVQFFDREHLERRSVGPALGLGFMASTAEGRVPTPFLSRIVVWLVRKMKSTPEQKEAHGVKSIIVDSALRRLLFFTFRKNAFIPPSFIHPVFRIFRSWHKEQLLESIPLLPLHQKISLTRIGNLFLVACPGEFTVQSSLRLKNTIREAIFPWKLGANDPTAFPIHFLGYTNGYGSYVTTPEEYGLQRYEGACTLYGTHTLTAYLKAARKIGEEFSAELAGELSTSGAGESIESTSGMSAKLSTQWAEIPIL